jgi:hypothetical protein
MPVIAGSLKSGTISVHRIRYNAFRKIIGWDYLGHPWSRHPGKAGVHPPIYIAKVWIPAFAGMTWIISER